jgi:flagellar protein FliO/FliZ
MAQTLTVVVLFIAGMACLPWLVRWIQQRQTARGVMGMPAASKVISAVAVGPQQRVVTVEVGPEHARTLLVLGVTSQHISCLYSTPAQTSAAPESSASFSREMARVASAKESDV